jgi:hypothetical protein
MERLSAGAEVGVAVVALGHHRWLHPQMAGDPLADSVELGI